MHTLRNNTTTLDMRKVRVIDFEVRGIDQYIELAVIDEGGYTVAEEYCSVEGIEDWVKVEFPRNEYPEFYYDEYKLDNVWNLYDTNRLTRDDLERFVRQYFVVRDVTPEEFEDMSYAEKRAYEEAYWHNRSEEGWFSDVIDVIYSERDELVYLYQFDNTACLEEINTYAFGRKYTKAA